MKAHTGLDLAVDLALAEAMVKDLEDYLLSDRLFYQLVVRTPAGDRQPKLTPGVLTEILSQLEWGRAELSNEEQQALDEAQASFAAVKKRMAVLWRQKVLAELHSLLASWTWFMQDCEDRRRRCGTEYDAEVQIRVRAEALMRELDPGPEVADLRQRFAVLDTKLARVFRAGTFVWDQRLESHYPRQAFWFLYGKPTIRDDEP